GAAQGARASRSTRGGVGDPEPELEECELLQRLEAPRREAGVVEQPPEVVARVGEVRGMGRGDPARVDPAEDAGQPGRENIRHRAGAAGTPTQARRAGTA